MSKTCQFCSRTGAEAAEVFSPTTGYSQDGLVLYAERGGIYGLSGLYGSDGIIGGTNVLYEYGGMNGVWLWGDEGITGGGNGSEKGKEPNGMGR